MCQRDTIIFLEVNEIGVCYRLLALTWSFPPPQMISPNTSRRIWVIVVDYLSGSKDARCGRTGESFISKMCCCQRRRWDDSPKKAYWTSLSYHSLLIIVITTQSSCRCLHPSSSVASVSLKLVGYILSSLEQTLASSSLSLYISKRQLSVVGWLYLFEPTDNAAQWNIEL